ncbi:MAG: hypothetical protein A3G41_05680 [Elusimicrobia bacterium RIFCSPLOWO2_12_FULL_59_9]|nr:MAG: hypothetical protein A3G41_05680 [Elusimicrobia bacterium RIFCSPLOWO2_12_FULL_59_9]
MKGDGAKSAPQAGLEITRWGESGQWRDFFQERNIRRDIQASLMPRDSVIYLMHGDNECQMASPEMDGNTVSFFSYPWVNPVSGIPHGRGYVTGYLTDLRDKDVVLGAIGKLDALMRSVAKEAPKDSLVVFTPDCVPILIGEDMDSCVNRHKAVLGSRLIFLNLADDPQQTLFEKLFANVKKEAALDRSKGPHPAVNLVGFPDLPSTRELTLALERLGIRVNARLLPDFSLEEMRRWWKADLQVFFPHAMMETIYKRAFSDVEIPAITPPPPYGIAGTQRWLDAIASALSRQNGLPGVWEQLLRPLAQRWNRLVQEARQYEVAVVDDTQHLSRYSDWRQTFGVPLLPVLSEMGLNVRFLLYLEPGRFPPPPRKNIEFFSNPEALNSALKKKGFQGVFSNVFFDRRVTRAGKVPLSFQLFEMGLEGAVRSLERMLRSCRLRFYERYSSFGPQ